MNFVFYILLLHNIKFRLTFKFLILNYTLLYISDETLFIILIFFLQNIGISHKEMKIWNM